MFLFQRLVQYYFCVTVTNLDELTSYIIIKEEDYGMLVKFGNNGFQKFLSQSNWPDFLRIFFLSSYNQIGHHVVLIHIKVGGKFK